MPLSSAEGKDWIHSHVAELTRSGPVSVVDIGPGVGTYAKLLKDLPIDTIVGIEAWAPYVTTYRLHDHYDEIVVGDARTVALPPTDVVILGDVIEHMTRDQALELWARACDAATRAVYLSIPIVHYPQHEIEGNPFELHVEEDWSHEQVLDAFAGIGAWWTGSEVGVYEWLRPAA